MDYPGVLNIITWALANREYFLNGGRKKKCGRRENKNICDRMENQRDSKREPIWCALADSEMQEPIGKDLGGARS